MFYVEFGTKFYFMTSKYFFIMFFYLFSPWIQIWGNWHFKFLLSVFFSKVPPLCWYQWWYSLESLECKLANYLLQVMNTVTYHLSGVWKDAVQIKKKSVYISLNLNPNNPDKKVTPPNSYFYSYMYINLIQFSELNSSETI